VASRSGEQTMEAKPPPPATFTHNSELSRYEAHVDGRLAGWIEHRPAGDSVILAHTEVLDAFEGQGLGGRLVRHALDAARSAGKSVIVTCPFAGAYVDRHPELKEYLDTV
jgi:predicted GNAT family acetyltransferase